ncbi:hypothetical protein ACWGK1_00550 [Streptomyces wedmorensis]
MTTTAAMIPVITTDCHDGGVSPRLGGAMYGTAPTPPMGNDGATGEGTLGAPGAAKGTATPSMTTNGLSMRPPPEGAGAPEKVEPAGTFVAPWEGTHGTA